MKLKVTQKMTNELNKSFKTIDKVSKYKLVYEKMSDQAYKLNVDMYARSMDADYDVLKGKWCTIKVLYPDEYYAMPTYLTTSLLESLFRKSDGTWQRFVKEVADYIEV